jgi:hypothetical protein
MKTTKTLAIALMALALPAAAMAGGENSPATGENRSVNDPRSPHRTAERGSIWDNWGRNDPRYTNSRMESAAGSNYDRTAERDMHHNKTAAEMDRKEKHKLKGHNSKSPATKNY